MIALWIVTAIIGIFGLAAALWILYGIWKNK